MATTDSNVTPIRPGVASQESPAHAEPREPATPEDVRKDVDKLLSRLWEAQAVVDVVKARLDARSETDETLYELVLSLRLASTTMGDAIEEIDQAVSR